MYLVRLLGLACAAATLLVAFGWASRDALAALGLDVWELPDEMRALTREDERRTHIEESFALVEARLHLKHQLATELVAGRLTLQEAANRLRPLMGPEDGDTWQALRRREQAGTDDERLCRHLLDVARGVAERPGSAEETRRVLRTLEGQLPAGGSRPSQEPSAVPGLRAAAGHSQHAQLQQPRRPHHPAHRRRPAGS